MPPIGIAGAGVVGSRIVRMLDGIHPLAIHDRAVSAAREIAVAYPSVDVVDRIEALDDCAVVVLTQPQPGGDVVARLLRAGVHVVSVSGVPETWRAYLPLAS